jgi:hypothetical protein
MLAVKLRFLRAGVGHSASRLLHCTLLRLGQWLRLLCPALAREEKNGNQDAGEKSAKTQQRKSSTG